MYRSFFKFFTPRHFSLLSAFTLVPWLSHKLTSSENERINQKLKRKLNEKFHDRKDISFELTDEFRYAMPKVGKIWSSSLEIRIRPLQKRSLRYSKYNWEASKSADSLTEKSQLKSKTMCDQKMCLSSNPLARL